MQRVRSSFRDCGSGSCRDFDPLFSSARKGTRAVSASSSYFLFSINNSRESGSAVFPGTLTFRNRILLPSVFPTSEPSAELIETLQAFRQNSRAPGTRQAYVSSVNKIGGVLNGTVCDSFGDVSSENSHTTAAGLHSFLKI